MSCRVSVGEEVLPWELKFSHLEEGHHLVSQPLDDHTAQCLERDDDALFHIRPPNEMSEGHILVEVSIDLVSSSHDFPVLSGRIQQLDNRVAILESQSAESQMKQDHKIFIIYNFKGIISQYWDGFGDWQH